MIKLAKISRALILVVFILFISGCQLSEIGDKLKFIDEKIGEGFDEFQEKQQEDLVHFMDKDKKEELEAEDLTSLETRFLTGLTKEQKEKIDKWIEENGLNRYGDSKDTMYIGGTPLYNEATGEITDRYDYILKNHLDLLNKLDKESF